MEQFETAVVLTRVLTSGVVMSIEKSDRELPGLERLLTKTTGRSHAVLLNSRTGAIHAAVAGQGIGHGNELCHPGPDDQTIAFLGWLGITVRRDGEPSFGEVTVTPDNVHRLAELARASTAPALVLNLTDLGFGPAAAMMTDDPAIWARAERLKIFGPHDLRTMWTQTEDEPGLAPGVQFNYRLSPLVAACLRMSISTARSGASS
jgi:dTDP-4-amino-4,6-dideoxygalactose transaminase